MKKGIQYLNNISLGLLLSIILVACGGDNEEYLNTIIDTIDAFSDDSDESVDTDGDGSSDTKEIANGTDPLDPSSFPRPFKIKVRTSTINQDSSSDLQFVIPTKGDGYNYSVDCDSDGTLEATDQTSDYICNYATAGDYTISISGIFPQIYFFRATETNDSKKVLSIEQWGTSKWRDMTFAFYNCKNMTYTATDKPDLSKVTNLSGMFDGASSFNGNISGWDVSSVVNMRGTFSFANSFNQNLGTWDVSSVDTMQKMFFSVKLSSKNYDSLLTSWGSLDLQKSIKFHGGNSEVGSLEASQARGYLRSNFGWIISDGDD